MSPWKFKRDCISFYCTRLISFYTEHNTIPDIESVTTSPTSIAFSIFVPDKYELNGRLRSLNFYYQPIPVYTQTLGDEFSEHVLNDVRSHINDTNYVTKFLPLSNSDVFSRKPKVTSIDFEVEELSTYTFYAFYLTYQTEHSESLNRTEVNIVRTKEGGKIFHGISSSCFYEPRIRLSRQCLLNVPLISLKNSQCHFFEFGDFWLTSR